MSSSSSSSESRRELLEKIESQKETIAKFETRLKDVVRAYKGLAKEKEALEASLSAISDAPAQQEAAEGAAGDPAEEAAAAAGVDSDAQSTSSSNQETSGGGGGGHSQSSRVKTLAASLATLAAEKSRLEANFQEDRKKLVQEKKERERTLDALRKDLASVQVKAKADLDEAKSKLIVERHEREKETSDHQVMLREIQKLLADERRGKERLETALNEAQDQVRSLQLAAADGSEESGDRKLADEHRAAIQQKDEEIAHLRAKLDETPPEVLRVKREMQDLRSTQRRALDRSERKAEEAEARVSAARVEQEQRVNSLEARLQELSETVGTYDRLRQHDQAEIGHLKEKVHLAEQEKAVLASASTPPNQDKLSQADFKETDDVQALIEKFYQLKTALRSANQKAKTPVDLEALVGGEEAAKKWKREYECLKEEFETYKKRSPTVFTQQSSGRYLLPEVDQEVVLSLKTQIGELQDRMALQRQQLVEVTEEKEKIEEKERALQEAIALGKQKTKSEKETMEAEFRGKMLQLETEMQKQRERCLTMIEEKEDEVSMLKSNMELAFETAFAGRTGAGAGGGVGSQQDREYQLRMAAVTSALSRSTSVTSTGSAGGGAGGGRRRSRTQSTSADAVEDALQLTDAMKSGQNEGMVLHYVQELARKDAEIGQLRDKVFGLESAMRELQMAALAKEEKYVDEIDALQEQILRLKRSSNGGGGGGGKGDGGANMEYLKNVVLSYMLSSDAASRDHMLKAIGAVLIFSKGEVKQVRDYNASWFWTQSGQAGAGTGAGAAMLGSAGGPMRRK